MSRLVMVALGGALGAVSRYLLSGWVTRFTHESPFPWGTLGVNVVGSLLLGLLMGAGGEGRWLMSPTARVLLGVGFLGALSTFSTFSYETIEALRVGDVRIAFLNVAANLAATLVACGLGLQAGTRL